jgi:hypothetical protein
MRGARGASRWRDHCENTEQNGASIAHCRAVQEDPARTAQALSTIHVSPLLFEAAGREADASRRNRCSERRTLELSSDCVAYLEPASCACGMPASRPKSFLASDLSNVTGSPLVKRTSQLEAFRYALTICLLLMMWTRFLESTTCTNFAISVLPHLASSVRSRFRARDPSQKSFSGV